MGIAVHAALASLVNDTRPLRPPNCSPTDLRCALIHQLSCQAVLALATLEGEGWLPFSGLAEFHLANHHMRGIVDLLLVGTDGSVMVLDWKCLFGSGSLGPDTAAKNAKQLQLYAKLVAELCSIDPDSLKLRVVYLKENFGVTPYTIVSVHSAE